MADANGTTARRGNEGKVNVDDEQIARLTQWSLNSSVSETAWGDSDSEGFTNRSPARKDCTGSIQGKFDNDDKVYDLFAPGDLVELVLFEANVANAYWTFPSALIQNYQITYDQDSKEVVGWQSDWGADGRFYPPGSAGAPVQTYPS